MDELEEFEFRHRLEKERAVKHDPIKTAINKSATAGLVDAGLALGSGAVAGPVSGLAGLAGSVLPGPEGQGADWVKKTQNALTYQPQTTKGQGITQAASYPFMKLAELGDWAGGKTAEATGSPSAGAGMNTTLQAIPLMLGRVAPAPAVRKANPTVEAAREAGYVVLPTQANPTLMNKIAEGAGGKIKTAQDASIKNQEVTNNLVRESLGIPQGVKIDAAQLSKVRSDAGQAYERVRGSGRVTTDAAYSQALDSVAEPFVRASRDFPEGARTDIIDAVAAAKKPAFDASSAVDQIRINRKKADKAYADKDKDLGAAYKGIAAAMEDQLGRHLETIGAPENVISDFRRARETIAKSYTVEKHLQPSGNVNAQGLGNELKKGYLSGELKTAGEFGRNFRKAAQLPETIGGAPMSPFDHAISLASLGGAVASGQPLVALGSAAPYLRPVVRSGLLSDLYQDSFVNPKRGPSFLEQMQQAHRTPMIPLSEIAEGQRQ